MAHGVDYFMHAKTCPYLTEHPELSVDVIDLLVKHAKTCAKAKRDLNAGLNNLFKTFEKEHAKR